VLPLEVLQEVRDEIPEYQDAGATVLEISHRSRHYTEIAESARRRLRSLLGLDEQWHVLFLASGASMQFYQVPLNFLHDGRKAGYVVTGHWAEKARDEAAPLGEAYEVATTAATNHDHIPRVMEDAIRPGTAYVHFTSNNTIYGTQFATEPESAGVPLICDASSDFVGRPMDIGRYGLIYAGAQKNLGPAGVTVVLVRDDLLAQRRKGLPTLLDYGTHASQLYHTPPVFAVYVVEKVLRWLENKGGVDAMFAQNRRKAKLVYDELDGGFYRGHARAEARSLMNITFRLPTAELEKMFAAQAAQNGLDGLPGHRSVGGMRASVYNACPVESVQALADFMREFRRVNG
jgi:phosphoserine aminotransferase